MTYYVHKHNSGYYGRRAFNTLKKAKAAADEWVAMGSGRSATVDTKEGRFRYRYERPRPVV